MASNPTKLKNSGATILLMLGLTLAGCSNQTVGMNMTNLSSNAKASLIGAGAGILLGAAGGALVGAAIDGAPGIGAGIGALIGAGAGWAVASQSQSVQAQLAQTQEQVRRQQEEINENRRELASTHMESTRPPGSQSADSKSTSYTVKWGDTLSAIARLSYGDANQFPKIYEANKSLLKDPNEIYPGQVLRIPLQA